MHWFEPVRASPRSSSGRACSPVVSRCFCSSGWFDTSGLSQLDARLRRDSLAWPLVTGGLALVVVAVLARWTARGRARQSRGTVSSPPSRPPPIAAGDTSNASQRARLRRPTAGQVAGVLLLLLETAFLVASGAQLWSSSADGAEIDPRSDLPRTCRRQFDRWFRSLHLLRGAGVVESGRPPGVQHPVRAP